MDKKGFSLVELLVVVAIIGILATILVPNVQENLRRAKMAQTKALISNIEMAITTFESDFGRLPPSYDLQNLFIATTERSSSPYEANAGEFRFVEEGDSYWINPNSPREDTRLQDLLQQAGVPQIGLVASMDENIFIDAWGNPIYYISRDVYNPGGRADFRQRSGNIPLDKPATYQMRQGSRSRPFNSTTFQLISFGPDGATITPSQSNGGIGSMLPNDNVDNDGDEFVDHTDQVRRGDRNSNDPEVLAEDDVTNFN